MPKTLRLILGDQLNSQYSWFNKVDPDVWYVLMEVMQEQQYVRHHIQKVLGFFAAMRNFSHQLSKQGHQVIYLKLDEPANQQNFEANLVYLVKNYQIEQFEYQLPDEYRLDEQLKEIAGKLGINSAVYDTEHFLTTRFEVKDFFGDRKSYLMESFYRKMRVRLNILMNGDEPAGKRWNFDIENRKKYDNKVPLHDTLLFDHDVRPLKEMIDKMQVMYFGNVDAGHFA